MTAPTTGPARTAGANRSAGQASERSGGSSGRAGVVHVLALALIVTAAVALYLPSVNRPFFADDYLFLDQVRDRPLLVALTSVDPLSNFYRPVSRQLYFWLVSHASGETEVAFHATSIALFAGLLIVLWWVARGLAGAQVALIATAFVALHYAPDVAVRWACGSQELLSVGFALATIGLYTRGRRGWAGVTMLLAALSKEVILLAPLIAIAADKRPGETWHATLRRAWPLGVAIAMWLVIFVATPHRRAQQATEVELDPSGPIATLVHLAQVTLGAEWRPGLFSLIPKGWPPPLSLALALAAVLGARWWAGRTGGAGADETGAAVATSPGTAHATAESSERRPERRRAREGAASRVARPGRWSPWSSWGQWARLPRPVQIGLLWAVLAAAPVAAVAPLWSAYYYLFAMCGVGLVLGTLLARTHWGWTVAVLGVLAWSSSNARALQEFATPRSPWTGQSHINAFYMDRSARVVARYLEDLKRVYPAFPPRSTIFFAGIKGNVAFQVAEGPLMRWAYRDTSLRSHYLYDFSRARAERGPTFYFVGEGDSLVELEHAGDLHKRIALGMILSDQVPQALDALAIQLERHPDDWTARYATAWLYWMRGERAASHAALVACGYAADVRPSPDEGTVQAALSAIQRGDGPGASAMVSTAIARNPYDPGLHSLLADILLVMNHEDPRATIEALAARVLAPDLPLNWRRWGMVQLDQGRQLEALNSLKRYQEIGGATAAADTEAKGWMESIRAAAPRGVFTPEERRP